MKGASLLYLHLFRYLYSKEMGILPMIIHIEEDGLKLVVEIVVGGEKEVEF